jgi:NADPH-dependent glutamate synthase beta subunit-like oxidoreductase
MQYAGKTPASTSGIIVPTRRQMSEIEGLEFSLETDLVTLAMGFLHPVNKGMLQESEVTLDDEY